jgi:hypothetical protein
LTENAGQPAFPSSRLFFCFKIKGSAENNRENQINYPQPIGFRMNMKIKGSQKKISRSIPPIVRVPILILLESRALTENPHNPLKISRNLI